MCLVLVNMCTYCVTVSLLHNITYATYIDIKIQPLMRHCPELGQADVAVYLGYLCVTETAWY